MTTSIDVLFASRGRPGSLIQATRSLFDTAAAPAAVRVAVAIDPDDDATLALKASELPVGTELIIAPERYGYMRLHQYLNMLVKTASADWLMWFNDDMRMLTIGWDDIITSHRHAVICPSANHLHSANIAPAWPRCWSDAVGYGSPTAHLDTYWQRVGESIGRHDRVPVEIMHDRADVTGNHDDQTYAEGRKLIGTEGMVPGFNEDEFYRRVAADAAIIREFAGIPEEGEDENPA